MKVIIVTICAIALVALFVAPVSADWSWPVHSLPWADWIWTSTSQGDKEEAIPFFNSDIYTTHEAGLGGAQGATAYFEIWLEHYDYVQLDDDDRSNTWEYAERSIAPGKYKIDWISWSGYTVAQYEIDIVEDEE